MRPQLMLASAACFLLAGATSNAHADATPRAYAIVVGSNPGGAGQQTLQFAERDATRVAGVLRNLGGYKRADISLLQRPTSGQLLGAINRVGKKLARDAKSGKQSVVLFYYSGHARANALNLGDQELSLTKLRERIMAMPATLRVVILDACQSGAFSKVKGVAPAADFSFNSVKRLNAAGVAVMASSAASELSQESPQLGGSYFTHHLLVALRGAGDKNRDGRVSLNEAYSYAYNSTLIATAKTAVGRQHVTLETDLKGKGDVALTYPARATAKLILPPHLKGELLIYRRKSKVVIAEVHKTTGTVRLALPPASYRVIIRQGKSARECDVDLSGGGPSTVNPNRCRAIKLSLNASKGLTTEYHISERFSIVYGWGWGSVNSDAYTDTLLNFGYDRDGDISPTLDLTFSYRFHKYAAAVGTASLLELNSYFRHQDTSTQRFGWNTYGVSGGIRGMYPLTGQNGREILVPFVELRAGLAYARTDLMVGEATREEDGHLGYQFAASAGAHLMVFDTWGISLKATAVFAPAIENLLGETHDAGGIYKTFGIRKTF